MFSRFAHGTGLALEPGGGGAGADRSERDTPKGDTHMEKQKPFGGTHKASQPKDRDRVPPAKQPAGGPAGPGERSDEESIGRPVQLDHPQEKPRRPDEPEQRQ